MVSQWVSSRTAPQVTPGKLLINILFTLPHFPPSLIVVAGMTSKETTYMQVLVLCLENPK